MNDLVNGSFVSLEESKLQNTCCENVLEMDGKAFTYRAQFCLQKDPFEFCELCNQHIFFALVIFINLSVFFQPIYSYKKIGPFWAIFVSFLVHFWSISCSFSVLFWSTWFFSLCIFVFLSHFEKLLNYFLSFSDPFLVNFNIFCDHAVFECPLMKWAKQERISFTSLSSRMKKGGEIW